MRIDVDALHAGFERVQRGKRSRHSVEDRVRPSLFQYDYLTLSALSADIRSLIAELPPPPRGARALDVGSDKSPYRALLERKGFEVRTLDLTRASGADFEGTVERTNLPDASFDLVLCTQVLEHCQDPWQGIGEMRRILTAGGHCILSVPHVWFFHPHPHDHWRFTQEGVVHLCRGGGLAPITLLAQGGSVLTAAQIVNFLLYGALGRLGGPIYAVVNLLAKVSDRLLPNELFCCNFACLARRA